MKNKRDDQNKNTEAQASPEDADNRFVKEVEGGVIIADDGGFINFMPDSRHQPPPVLDLLSFDDGEDEG